MLLQKRLTLLCLPFTILIGPPLAASGDDTLDRHIDDMAKAWEDIENGAKTLDYINFRYKLKIAKQKASLEIVHSDITTIKKYVEFFKKGKKEKIKNISKLEQEKIDKIEDIKKIKEYCHSQLIEYERHVRGNSFDESRFDNKVYQPFISEYGKNVASLREGFQKVLKKYGKEATDKETLEEKDKIANIKNTYPKLTDK
ncbi:MAG: hypothetical protein AAF335_01855 [Bacteroidota bacterium]